MKTQHRLLLMAAVFVMTVPITGCSFRAQQLKSQPLNTTLSIPSGSQTDKKFLVYPLEDLRGGEYGIAYPIVPFHMAMDNRYIESTEILQSSQGGKATFTVGSMPAAFPYLLANMMRETRFTNNATPLDQLNTKVDLDSFDYVVKGKLINTKMVTHSNMIPLGLLSIFGVPFIFVNYTLEFEVSLYQGKNIEEPILTRTYLFEDKKVRGMYYGFSAHFDLFMDGLEGLLPDVVQDIANAIQ